MHDDFCRRYGTRQFLWGELGLDAKALSKKLAEMVIKV